jgi:hypothetical protein
MRARALIGLVLYLKASMGPPLLQVWSGETQGVGKTRKHTHKGVLN